MEAVAAIVGVDGHDVELELMAEKDSAREANAKDPGALDQRTHAAFLKEQAARFREFAEDAERGDFSFDLDSELKKIEQQAKRVEPLRLIRDIAQRCADAIPPMLRLEKVAEDAPLVLRRKETVRAMQVRAHWQLAHLEPGGDDDLGLTEDAGRVTPEAVQAQAEALAAIQDEIVAIETRLAAVTLLDDYAVDGRREMADEIEKWQKTRLSLLKLIGAQGQSFNPSEDYQREYRRALAERAIASGRSVEPNGAAIKAQRAKAGWTQTALAIRARGRSKNKSLSARTIRRMEQGEYVDGTTLKAVAEALGSDYRDFIH